MQHTETKDELRTKLKDALGELIDTQEQNSTLLEVQGVLINRIKQLEAQVAN
tara:strand:- start:4568 stop:4723 length:156 start_codon:yes stop_codon:yes gene_type:complete